MVIVSKSWSARQGELRLHRENRTVKHNLSSRPPCISGPGLWCGQGGSEYSTVDLQIAVNDGVHEVIHRRGRIINGILCPSFTNAGFLTKYRCARHFDNNLNPLPQEVQHCKGVPLPPLPKTALLLYNVYSGIKMSFKLFLPAPLPKLEPLWVKLAALL